MRRLCAVCATVVVAGGATVPALAQEIDPSTLPTLDIPDPTPDPDDALPDPDEGLLDPVQTPEPVAEVATPEPIVTETPTPEPTVEPTVAPVDPAPTAVVEVAPVQPAPTETPVVTPPAGPPPDSGSDAAVRDDARPRPHARRGRGRDRRHHPRPRVRRVAAGRSGTGADPLPHAQNDGGRAGAGDDAGGGDHVYTVRAGDCLSVIARRVGADWHVIARLNRLPDPDLIYPGERLRLP